MHQTVTCFQHASQVLHDASLHSRRRYLQRLAQASSSWQVCTRLAIISASLLFWPALTRCCPLHVLGIYVSAWPMTVKPRDESQKHNEAGSAKPALHGLLDEAVARSHKSQSKSDTFMPVIWIAGNLFSCNKQSSVQCTTPY